MSKENLVPVRCKSPCADHRESERFLQSKHEIVNDFIIVHQRRRCQSQLSVGEHLRSASQHKVLPACNKKYSLIIFCYFYYSNGLLRTL